jgi:hypothetical protein
VASLTIAIDRAGMTGDPDPLIFSATASEQTWGIMPGFQEPGQIARVNYATAPWVHGDLAVSSSWQHAYLSWQTIPDVASEAALRAAVAEVRAALGRLSFAATVTRNGAASVWACDTGSISPAPVGRIEVSRFQPVYEITIPCYPLPIGTA